MPRVITVVARHARPFCGNAHAHGWRVAAVDGFGDHDLARCASALKTGMGETPEAFLNGWRKAEGPVMFGAPIEAAPLVLEEAARRMVVLNAPAHAVATARDDAFAQSLAGDGVLLPPRTAETGSPRAGWIVKSRVSAGGTGIRPDDGAPGANEYRQQLVAGQSIGALYCAGGGECHFLGVSLHISNGFLYGGGLFPFALEKDVARRLELFGARAAKESGMSGFWGADFMLNGEGLWLLEINPRPTATSALFMQRNGIDGIAAQQAAVEGRPHDLRPTANPGADGIIGNRVLYAEREFVFGGAEEWYAAGARDVPRDGSMIKAGAPVMTFYAAAASADACRAALEAQCADAQRALRMSFPRKRESSILKNE